MKYTNLLIGAAMLVSTAFASAADIGVSKTLKLERIDDIFNAEFSHTFKGTDKGKTFLDVYTFNITDAILSASFSSPAVFRGTMATSDLAFTSFDLYSSGGARVATGIFSSAGVLAGWDAGGIINTQLGAGTYSLQVSGSVLGSSGGFYNGGVTVSPVPEPETWGMTLSGLAVIGFAARRHKANRSKSP